MLEPTYTIEDLEFMNHHYNIAIATGLNKHAAKKFAAAVRDNKKLDIAHLRPLN